MDLIRDLDANDVMDIEADLSLCEKTSVAFLLSQDLLEVDFFLQQLTLLAAMKDSTHQSNIFLEWSRRHSADFAGRLIEALCIAQANHVLAKLGLNLDKLSLYYFPTRPEIITHVNPVVKLLYLMAERLTVSESTELLKAIHDQFEPELSSLAFFEPLLLEIHLLHWISQRIIMPYGDSLQLDPLISFFKRADNLDLYDFLKSNLDGPRRLNPAPRLVRDEDSGDSGAGGNGNMTVQSIPSMNSLRIEGESSYLINQTTPGVLLIINQNEFHMEEDPTLAYLLPKRPLEERKGTEKDVEALKRCFAKCHYRIILKEDLPHQQILHEIKRAIESLTKSESSLFIAILSHGIEGCVYGSNSIPLEVREIKNHIYRCGDHLLGRPKCLIIQACQGQDLQISKIIDNHLQTDSPNSVGRPLAIPPCSDLLIAWSTVEGFASLRHILTGTWFIQTLCEVIEENHKTTHLVDILTLVNNKIASMKGNRNESMIPKIESTFRKKFFFPPLRDI